MENLKKRKSKSVEEYKKNGYVIFRNVLDEELIKEAQGHIDWLQKKYPDIRPENLGKELVANDPFWLRLISDCRLLDVAEQFIGPNIALFASHYICKPPFHGHPVLWHQDGSYWPLQPMEVITLWLAVDDSLLENGCMKVIPGTQNYDLKGVKDRLDVENVLGSSIDESFVDESKSVDVILKAGDVSIHHPNIIHGSHANNSALRRGGLTIRYIPTTTQITEQPWDCSFLLRGEPVEGINQYLLLPKFNPEKHYPFKGSGSWK